MTVTQICLQWEICENHILLRHGRRPIIELPHVLYIPILLTCLLGEQGLDEKAFVEELSEGCTRFLYSTIRQSQRYHIL